MNPAKESYFDVTKRVLEILALGVYRKYGFPLISLRNALTKVYTKEKDFSFKIRKMANVDAAIINVQLKKLGRIIALRRRNAKILSEELESIPQISLPEYTKEHVFSKYIITFDDVEQPRSNSRAEKLIKFSRFLAGKGIETEWSYIPLHTRKPFNRYYSKPLPKTEKIWYRVITLPVNPNFNEEQMKYIASVVKEYFTKVVT